MILQVCRLFTFLTAVVILSQVVSAQTTAFSYQGHLNNGAAPANGNYEMQFKLFDSMVGGAQVGGTVTDASVAVINGTFATALDFGSAPFDAGPARYLEIAVRPAGGGGPFTILSPRQTIRSAPYAIQAKSALTADTATNALQLGGVDASEYVTIGSVGNSFIKNDTTVQPTANFNVSGNGTLGGILTANAVTAQTGTGFYGVRHTDGATTIGTYVGSGTGASGGWLGTQSNSPLHFFTNNGQARMTIDTAGNVGVGTFTPLAGYKLDVNGAMLVRSAGTGGNMQFASPNGETGITISGTNRADVRFDGTTLRLFAGTGVTPPATGLIVNTLGNVATSGNLGVGTFAPDTRLTLNGGPAWTSNFWTASMNLRNASAIGWDANPSGQRFGIGQSTGGLYFFRTVSSFGTTASPSNLDMVITDTGNITQPRDKNGLVKGMIYVNPNGTIGRCFNGITNSSTGGCGFVVARTSAGRYTVNFNFQIDDRFVVGNAFDNPATPGCLGSTIYIFATPGTNVDLATTCGGSGEDAPFTLVVY